MTRKISRRLRPEGEWREIPGCSTYYISPDGRVWSWWSQRELKVSVHQSKRNMRYPVVAIFQKQWPVHQLLMLTFVGPCPEGQEVCHIDGDSENSVLSNLRYGTHGQNMRDAVRHGTHNEARKTECPRGHPYDEANTYVRQGRRTCRACWRTRSTSSTKRKVSA